MRNVKESSKIEITGIASTTSKETLEMFLENERKSGGGEIKELYYLKEQEKAIVEYTNAEGINCLVVNRNVC